MPVYLCRWPDGNLAIVTAEDVEEAAMRLDEFANPDDGELREIDDLSLNLELTDHGDLRVAQWGDTSREDVFAWAYPELDATLTQEPLGAGEPVVGADQDPVSAAVEWERKRLVDRPEAGARPRAKTAMGRQVQDALGAPAALADHLAEQVATRILEETDIEGQEN